jgi:hypothetical protein
VRMMSRCGMWTRQAKDASFAPERRDGRDAVS